MGKVRQLTRFHTAWYLSGRSENVVERFTAAMPMGRLGEPDDIAGIISLLAGPGSSGVSSQIIKESGGRN